MYLYVIDHDCTVHQPTRTDGRRLPVGDAHEPVPDVPNLAHAEVVVDLGLVDAHPGRAALEHVRPAAAGVARR